MPVAIFTSSSQPRPSRLPSPRYNIPIITINYILIVNPRLYKLVISCILLDYRFQANYYVIMAMTIVTVIELCVSTIPPLLSPAAPVSIVQSDHCTQWPQLHREELCDTCGIRHSLADTLLWLCYHDYHRYRGDEGRGAAGIPRH